MNLTITIASAANLDQAGTVSAVGLGAGMLRVASFPTVQHGSLVLIITPDDNDESGMRDFEVRIKVPGSSDPMMLANGRLIVGNSGQQTVLTAPFAVPLDGPGEYVVEAVAGEASGRLVFVVFDVSKAAEGEPS